MAVHRFLFPFFFFAAAYSPMSTLSDSSWSAEPSDSGLMNELEAVKQKISHLDLVMVNCTRDLNLKSNYLKELEKQIEEMPYRTKYLESVLHNTKDHSSPADNRLAALEEEVRLLWAALRRNNFDLHNLQYKADDAEERLEAVTSEVKKMTDIVNEQWIQIQHLEQAVQMAEMRARKARKQVKSRKCTLLKFMNRVFDDLRHPYEILDLILLGKTRMLSSIVSHALNQIERVFKAVQEYHHELQKLIKQEMERYEYTAPLADKEVVFFVASALVIFPIMGAWVLLYHNLAS